MSAHISVVDGDRIVMLTDGAHYDRDGILHKIGRKVHQVGDFPVLITTRGSAEHGLKIRDAVERTFETVGDLDDALDVLYLSLTATPVSTGYPAEMTLAAFSSTQGTRLIQFNNLEHGWRETNRGYVCEQEIDHKQHAQLLSGPPQHTGLRLMEQLRLLKIPAPGQPEPDHFIGGQVDFATVGPEGVTIETIHHWPDRIGAKLQPGANLNRHQRRALARKGA